MVYVLNKDGKPLMPTKKHGMVKHFLKNGLAKVVQRTPFTIQLTYQATEYTQPLTLGVDAGSKTVGLSVTTEKEEVYSAECKLRTDVTDHVSTRRQFRTARRSRKTRYRKKRFLNRHKSKEKGWLAPTIRQKINTHVQLMKQIHKILPISKIIVEVANFDIQKIKNPDITGKEYQQGEKLDFFNVREYVLFRDGHVCQHCNGKSKDKILNVHHMESRKTGGNSPDNLITLCKTCHNRHHKGEITLKGKRGQSFKDATFMGILRRAFYNQLKATYENVNLTYGYITKNSRIRNGLQKTHAVDARCISGNPTAKPLGYFFQQQAKRTRNRQIHKAAIQKGGYRKLNQQPKYVFGFQLFDKVKTPDRQEGFVFGRRKTGNFLVKSLDEDYKKEMTYKKLIQLEQRSTILIEKKIC